MSDEFAGGFDPRMFEQVPLFRELAKVMAWEGGPVNWDLARQTAESIAAKVPDPRAIGEGPGDDLPTVVGVAELWLDEVTALGRVAGSERMLSAGEWVALATTHEGLGRLVEPVARGMGAALMSQLPDQLSDLDDAAGMGGMPGMGGLLGGGGLERAMNAMGAMMYGVQIGTIAGHLSGQLIGSYDLGVPTVDPHVVATVGGTADRFAADYDIATTEFRYWVGLREAVHRRMFAGVAWLSDTLSGLIEQFAGEAEFDPSQMFDQLRGAGLDPNDPESLQKALEDPSSFEIEPTTAQRRTLEQLQALVAFVEGYAEVVIRAAAERRLTALPRIEETMTRRRAEKGPGEQFLQSLVGLDLKPSDLRAGRAFCEAVIAARGQEGLDRVWTRSSYLPHADEVAEPSRWLVRMAAAELEDPELS
jgi:putative hydrolase